MNHIYRHMKKLLTVLAILTALTLSVLATDLTFSWKANHTNEMVTSYVIESSKVAPYTNFIPVVTIAGTNVGTIRGVTAYAKYRVVAKNGVGSSPPSNTADYPTNAPTAPVEFKNTGAK